MSLTPAHFPQLIAAVTDTINRHAEAVTELDQAIGDGDHVYNLQRGLKALQEAETEISQLSWPAAWQKIGMILMSQVGGASGSLYATLFISLSKQAAQAKTADQNFASAFTAAIEAVKQRGKADVGEKTMLDVWVPVAEALTTASNTQQSLPTILTAVEQAAEAGVEATRNMIATKGRASFLGERSVGHIDAGAKTAQLMVSALVNCIRQLP